MPCRDFETGRLAPKGILLVEAPNSTIRPQQPSENSLIYETHLAGLTRHPASNRLTALLAAYPEFASVPAVADDQRGTYRGAAMLAPYLKALGVNVVEFLPVQEFDNDDNPVDQLEPTTGDIRPWVSSRQIGTMRMTSRQVAPLRSSRRWWTLSTVRASRSTWM